MELSHLLAQGAGGDGLIDLAIQCEHNRSSSHSYCTHNKASQHDN